MQGSMHRVLWASGWPARVVLVALIRLYRLTLGQVIGGGCRFHPSCSAYAEGAIEGAGAVRGTVLAAWRILRCSPLTRGGVDHPPERRDHPFLYEVVNRRRERQPHPYVSVIPKGASGSRGVQP